MLAIDGNAPNIDAPSSLGPFRLSEHGGRLCTVVYFFPKAFTPGCTRETERFRDDYNELRLAGAALVGISTDDHETQCKFAGSLRTTFPMIGDVDGAIAAAFDVRWPLVGLAQRVTYVLSPTRVVLGAFHHELSIEKHRIDVLTFVDALFQERRAARLSTPPASPPAT